MYEEEKYWFATYIEKDFITNKLEKHIRLYTNLLPCENYKFLSAQPSSNNYASRTII